MIDFLCANINDRITELQLEEEWTTRLLSNDNFVISLTNPNLLFIDANRIKANLSDRGSRDFAHKLHELFSYTIQQVNKFLIQSLTG